MGIDWVLVSYGASVVLFVGAGWCLRWVMAPTRGEIEDAFEAELHRRLDAAEAEWEERLAECRSECWNLGWDAGYVVGWNNGVEDRRPHAGRMPALAQSAEAGRN